MSDLFASRMSNAPNSFLREIFKSASSPNIISFAGGVPNPKFFPVQALAEATAKAIQKSARGMFQYGFTEGFLPLREWIAERYRQKYGFAVDPSQILITNGSQQGLDLLGKVFLDQGDHVAIESPGYLGAILSFSMFQPTFQPVPLLEDGLDIAALEETFQQHRIKFLYAVTNFQNPSGLTYSDEKRSAVAQLLQKYNVAFIEDDPYGELRYSGQSLPPMRYYQEENVSLLGSFSKIVSPGIRLGWVCTTPEIMKRLILAKQSADLQSNPFAQGVLYQYLIDNDVDEHIAEIKVAYKRQRDLMLAMAEELFPAEIIYTKPDGGMFLWCTLPENKSAIDLFYLAVEEEVAFVPGRAFYVNGTGENTFRLSFSNNDEAEIEEGMKRLAQAAKRLLLEKS